MKCSTIIVLVKQNINKKVFQQKYRIHKLPDKIPENARKLKVYHISFTLQKHVDNILYWAQVKWIKTSFDFSNTIMPYHNIMYFGEIFCWNAFLVKLALIYLLKNGDLQYHGEIISISAGLSVSHMFSNVP